MKKLSVLVLVSCSTVILLGIQSCTSVEVQRSSGLGEQEFYIPDVGEEMFGTWVNSGVDSLSRAQKLVFHSWGLLEAFKRIDSKTSDQRGTSTIAKKWIDEKGNTWYRDYQRWELSGGYGESVYMLIRVSEDGSVLEYIYAGSGWPNEEDMSPDRNTTYLRYERQE